MPSLKEKLERLYKLAILREEEEKDESRHNEARTSAFLLIKIARENGVKIIFKVPPHKEVPTAVAATPPARTSTPGPRPGGRSPHNPFNDFWGRGGADVFEEMFRDMNRRVQEETDRQKRGRQTVYDDIYAGVYGVTDDAVKKVQRRPGETDAEYRERLKQHIADSVADGFGGFKRPQRQPKKGYSSKAPPLITAKFAGVCRVCRKQYNLGDNVYWIQGWGCSHEACGYEELVKQAANG